MLRRHAQSREVADNKVVALAKEHIESIGLEAAQWEPLQEPVSGLLVRPSSNIESDDTNPVLLQEHAVGVVTEIDGDGDIFVAFPGAKNSQWIWQYSFDELEVASNLPRCKRF